MKRRILTGLLILIIATPMFATSIDDVVNTALSKSKTVESAKTTLLSNQLTAQLLLVEDNPSYSVSTGDLTWGDESSDSDYSDDFTFGPEFTFYFNDDSETTINTQSEFVIEDGDITGTKISSAITSTIDLNPDDMTDDITADMNIYEATYLYNNALLTLKGQIYTYISNILSYEKDLFVAENTLDEYQTSYDESIAIGSYIESDTEAQLQLAKIKTQENVIEQYKKNIELTKQQFESYTGVEYTELDDFDDVELSMDSSKLNSLITIADYQTQIYQEELRVLKEDTNEVELNGGIASNTYDDSSYTDEYSINGDATYSVNNFSFSGGVKGSWAYDTGDFTPYVLVNLTYTSDSTSTEDALEIQSKANDVQSSKLDYQEAISDHTLNIFSLQNDIQISNLELQQQNFDTQVNLQNLNSQQTLFDNGLITEDELQDAKDECQLDILEEQILKLDRLILQNNIGKEFI